MKKITDGINLLQARGYLFVSFKHIVLILLLLFAIGPLLWLVSIVFRPASETYRTPILLLPRTLTLENLKYVLGRMPRVPLFYRNSLIVTFSTVLSTVFVTALGGYAFARLDFRGRELIFWTILVTMFAPQAIAVAPLYELFFNLGLLDSLTALYLSYVAWNVGIQTLVMRGVFESIPKDLEDAAIVDGCSRFGIFWRICLPIASSGLIAVAIFTFVMAWGEYLFATTFISSTNKMPLALGIKLFEPGPWTGEWTFPVAASATLLAFAPTIVIYVLLQRWFTKGLVEGALKY